MADFLQDELLSINDDCSFDHQSTRKLHQENADYKG